MSKIGFIGLGNMGAPMAMNLAKAGHEVTGFDVADVSMPGIARAACLIDAAQDQDAVITMLPNGQIVRAVYQEIAAVAKPRACFIDCSTIDVESARAAHNLAQSQECLSIDAPVSGGVGGASAGTLTFMAGGSEDAFAAAYPYFEIMGQKAVHCGGAGAGQAAKICNNMLLGISMIGVCEAITLADHLGLERQKLFDVVSTSSGACWSMNVYCPAQGVGPKSPADNDYKPGFAAELMLKDLKLAREAAKTTHAATPLGQHATSLYETFLERQGLGKDFSAMLLYLAEMSKEPQH